jgi:hypothetical protein
MEKIHAMLYGEAKDTVTSGNDLDIGETLLFMDIQLLERLQTDVPYAEFRGISSKKFQEAPMI